MTFYQSWFSGLPFEWAQYSFMHHALVAIIIIAPLLSFIGTLAINHQMTFFSEAIGHATLAGLAAGILLGTQNPMGVMIVFSALLALVIAGIKKYSSLATDTTIALCMSFAVAVGLALLSHGGGFSRFSKYLTGDIFNITPHEIVVLLCFLVLTLLLGGYFFNRLLLFLVHPGLARARGIPLFLTESLLMIWVAVVVTVTLPWMGLLTINALIIFPAACAKNLALNIFQYILWAVVIGLISGIMGLLGSYYFDTASGASIVIVQMGFFLWSLMPNLWRARRQR
jgi:zinc transport system permease protein